VIFLVNSAGFVSPNNAYSKWIGNRRKLDELIKAMGQTSRDVEQLLRTRTAAKAHS
jgi:hypothetical protein